MPEVSSSPAPINKPKSAPQKAMEKMGLRRDIDLALHLPLRYEDETRLTPIAQAREGDTVQCEGIVTESRIELRGRRVLIVRIEDDEGGELLLRFIHFYPSHQKSLAEGARAAGARRTARWFLRPRDGAPDLQGRHRQHAAGHSADAGLPVAAPACRRPICARAVASGLNRADLRELLPPGTVPPGLPPLREALDFLHHPAPNVPLINAGRPQPSGLAAAQVRGAAGPADQPAARRSASGRCCAPRR